MMEDKAIQQVPIDKIICRKQVREHFDDDELLGLAQSISEKGILQSLLAHREGTNFVLDDGERRLRAARIAGLTTVPVVVEEHEFSEAEVMHRQLIANCQRSDLRPLETARAIDRLKTEMQWSAAQVAVKLGMSPATVSRLLSLLTLPVSVREQVESGAVPASTAYEIAGVTGAEAQERLGREAASGCLTREEVIDRKKSRKTKRRRANGRKTRAVCKRVVLLPLEDGYSLSVGNPETTLQTFTGWLLGLMNRLETIEPKDMSLTDAIGMVAAGNEA